MAPKVWSTSIFTLSGAGFSVASLKLLPISHFGSFGVISAVQLNYSPDVKVRPIAGIEDLGDAFAPVVQAAPEGRGFDVEEVDVEGSREIEHQGGKILRARRDGGLDPGFEGEGLVFAPEGVKALGNAAEAVDVNDEIGVVRGNRVQRDEFVQGGEFVFVALHSFEELGAQVEGLGVVGQDAGKNGGLPALLVDRAEFRREGEGELGKGSGESLRVELLEVGGLGMAVAELDGEIEIGADFVWLVLLVDLDGEEVVLLLEEMGFDLEIIPPGFILTAGGRRGLGVMRDRPRGHVVAEEFLSIEVDDGAIVALQAQGGLGDGGMGLVIETVPEVEGHCAGVFAIHLFGFSVVAVSERSRQKSQGSSSNSGEIHSDGGG